MSRVKRHRAGSAVAVDDLTDEEREFLSSHRGGVFAILNGDEGAVRDAREGIAKILEHLTVLYPSRTERLLVFAVMADLTHHARDELLDEVIASRFQWRQRDDGSWGALAWETREKDQLSSLSGLGRRAIQERVKRVIRSTLDEAKNAAACPDDPDGQHHVGCGCVE